ncbi:hypothetical protein QYF36_017186 [Acer negundo]|nr:hypothetical protein QYF36_017186 [Acer negundo]
MSRVVNRLAACASKLQRWNISNKSMLHAYIVWKKEEMSFVSKHQSQVDWERQRMDYVLNLVEASLLPDMREELDKPFKAEDVRVALFQMHLNKSPGIDSFSTDFFQRF